MSQSELIEAVKSGDRERVEALLNSGADVNQQDEQGWTPINFAAGNGNLPLVKVLVDRGADVFKTGRDERTPYMIALAAGRAPVARFLRDVEARYPGEKPARPERKYCKAYHLAALRKFRGWSESRINWQDKKDAGAALPGDAATDPFPEDKIVFIHQDFTVTESMWEGENVIFSDVTPDWKTYCADTLRFSVPDDLELIVENEAAV